MFQSTHPHGVRHGKRPFAYLIGAVSIHAPAWGATFGKKSARQEQIVSIHAPAWGATLYTDNGICAKGMFQSTHPHGVRL